MTHLFFPWPRDHLDNDQPSFVIVRLILSADTMLGRLGLGSANEIYMSGSYAESISASQTSFEFTI